MSFKRLSALIVAALMLLGWIPGTLAEGIGPIAELPEPE